MKEFTDEEISQMSTEELYKIAKLRAEERAYDIRTQDAQAKEQGATHKIIAWIHPNSGDDYQEETYLNTEPTQQIIDEILEKSCVKTDYQVIEL